MGLKSMSLLTGATVSATGGTALVFAESGNTITNGVALIVPADADYQTRRQATAKYRPPTLDTKTGTYGKDKKSVSYAVPYVLADGRVSFQTIRIECEVHPSYPAADALDLLKIGAQILTDTDAAAFWATGSTS